MESNRPDGVVALRSADANLIEAVRAVVALAGLPMVVYSPGASAPEGVRLHLDSAVENGSDDAPWVRGGARTAWVGTDTFRNTPTRGRSITLPEQAEELLAMARAAGRDRRARVVGIVGARGGAGASCFAAALARTCAASGWVTALLDLDGIGSGLDLLLGIEHTAGMRWADLEPDRGAIPPESLAASLPTWENVHVLSVDWRGGIHPGAGGEVFEALAAGHEVLVLDLPRTQTAWADMCDVVYVVARRDVLSSAAAQALACAWQGVDLRLVVRGPAPGGITAAEVAAACDLALVANMRAERGIAAAVERGVAPAGARRGGLRCGARAVLADLALRRS